jgi:hypothetical protein
MRHSGLLSCQTMKCPQKRVNSNSTLAVRTDQLQVSVDSAGHFAGDPTFVSGFESFEHQTSLRVLAPIPEPAEWSMLIAGLLVIGFIAKRRNRLLGGAVEA